MQHPGFLHQLKKIMALAIPGPGILLSRGLPAGFSEPVSETNFGSLLGSFSPAGPVRSLNLMLLVKDPALTHAHKQQGNSQRAVLHRY